MNNVSIKIENQKLTQYEYTSLQTAFDVFNKKLFDGTLPQVLITLRKHANSKGYFSPNEFFGRKSEDQVCEIALNPDSFNKNTDEEILSNLVHEMVHLWNYYFGVPTKHGYHSKIWARKMIEIGLEPIAYDYKNSMGKTGYNVDHEIIDNGKFQKVARQLLNKGFAFNWQSVKQRNSTATDEKILCSEKKLDLSKTRFSCPSCQQNAWAKSTAHIICGHCAKRMLTKQEINDLNNNITN